MVKGTIDLNLLLIHPLSQFYSLHHTILHTLQDFVSFNQSPRELENKLEQLRALDNNIKINVALAKTSPIGVDTEEDFVAIKKIMEYKSL